MSAQIRVNLRPGLFLLSQQVLAMIPTLLARNLTGFYSRSSADESTLCLFTIHEKIMSQYVMKVMRTWVVRAVLSAALGWGVLPPAQAETEEQRFERELRESSEEHMRNELGVNDITTPSIGSILEELGAFRPVPYEIIAANNREAIYENRMQTALHFGSLVADGFMLTIAERPQDVQDVGKALIRQSRALGVGDRLTKRSKSLFELTEKGDWAGMRSELIRTQEDVEKSMMDLRDEEMAHMISLGGWLRGFQLAAASCKANYAPERARILGKAEIVDYYLDRLNTLHPRLKKTEFAETLTARITEIRDVAAESAGSAPTAAQVEKMSALANDAIAVAFAPVDAAGKIRIGAGAP